MSKKNTDAKMSKGKFAFNIALVVLQVLIVIVAIAFSVSILLSTGYESNTDFGKSSIRLMPVLTDSMNGDKADSFKAGDLIIVKKADKEAIDGLKVGDIVTYLGDVAGETQFITHRIVDIRETEGENGTVLRSYVVMGDAETSGITDTKYSGDIKGVYVGKLPGVGSAVFWLQDPTHFFLVIMLPLILLLLYNAYLVIRFIMEAKLKKQREQLVGATSQGAVPLDEEEIKRRAIEEYLKAHGGADGGVTEDKPAPVIDGATADIKDVSADNGNGAEETATVSDTVQEQEQKEEEKADTAVTQQTESVQEEAQDVEIAQSESKQNGEENADVKQESAAVLTEKQENAQTDDSAQTADTVENVEEKTQAQEAQPVEEEKTQDKEQAQEAEAEAPQEEKPEKKPTAKKTETAKKTATAKKPAAKTTAKTSTKTASAGKTAAKTSTAKSASSKTAAAKKTTVDKTGARTSAKTTTGKKSATAKTAAKTTAKKTTKQS